MARYIDTLPVWPPGTPLPRNGQFIFYAPEAGEEFRVTPGQVGGGQLYGEAGENEDGAMNQRAATAYADRGPNYVPGAGYKQVTFLTRAEAIAANRPDCAVLEELDPLTLCTGTVVRVDLYPGASGTELILVYDDRANPFVGLRAYIDGNFQLYEDLTTDGLNPQKWVKKGSIEAVLASIRRYSATYAKWGQDETMKIDFNGTDAFFSAVAAGGPFPAPPAAGVATADWKPAAKPVASGGGPVSGRHRGEFTPDTEYLQYDLVTFNFDTFQAVADFTSGASFDPADWLPFGASATVQQEHSFELGQLAGIRDSRIMVKAPGGAVSAWASLPFFVEPGSVVSVFGDVSFPALDYQFPASGTLVLAPGSSLTLKNFRPPSGPFLLCGQGTLVSPVNIGPSAREVTIRDIQLSGYVYAFSYNIFGALRKLRIYNVRLTNADASQAAVTVDYGYAQNYYTYLQAEVIGCDITSAGDAIKFFDQFPGAAAGDAQAKATNSLLLLQNRIKVGSGKRVLNDDAGALSFVRGGNLYVAASVPAQAYAVVVGTDGGGTGSGQPAPSAGPALGTGTVVTFKVDTEYPELFSGSYTFDPTGAVLGVVVRARLGANATQPVVPTSFVLLAGAYAAGARHLYSFSVAPGGVIEYYITRLP